MTDQTSAMAILARTKPTVLETLVRKASPGPVMVNLQPDGTTTFTVKREWIESLAALVAEECARRVDGSNWQGCNSAADIRAAFPMPKD